MFYQIKFVFKALVSIIKKNEHNSSLDLHTKIFSYKNAQYSYYELIGKEKKTILIITGFNQTLKSWIKIASILTRDFRVIVLELPNRGKLESETANWTEIEFAEFCLAFIKEHIRNKFVLVGHSLGAKISTLVSLALSDKISLLVLYAVGGTNLETSLIHKMLKIIKKIFYNPRSKINWISLYKKINTKTILIYGQRDLITTTRVGKKISRLIANSTLKIIPNATHLAHEEFPETFVKYIEEEF